MGTKFSGPYKGFKFNLEARNVLPGAIASLSATALTYATVQLVFANAPLAASYEVSINGGAWVALAGTKIVDGLTAQTAYTFQVRGVNARGHGEASQVANATTPIQPPAQITNLTATALSSSTIQLTYTNAARATSHEYSITSGSTWIAVPGDKIITGLTAETLYSIQVRGVNAGGTGPFSNIATATTQAAVPAQITDLTATVIDSTSAQLAYSNAARALSYEYTINGGSTWTAVPGNKIITGLWPSTTYGVQVRGVNAAGNGLGSNVASITTIATLAYYGFSSAASDKSSAMSVTNMYAPTTSTTGSWQTARSLVGKTSVQKGYFEVRATGAFSGDLMVALGGITTAVAGGHPAQQSVTGGIGYYSNGTVLSQSTNVATGIGLYGAGDTIMVAYNGTKVWFGKNGVWAASSNPATNTGGYTVPTNIGPVFPMVSTFMGSGSVTFNVNFGQSAFTYSVPSGFDTWNVTSYPTSFGPESKSANITLSNFNLTISSSGGWNTALARSPRTNGKFYFEHVATTNCMIGLAPATAAASLGTDMRSLNGFTVYPGDGTIRVGQTTLSTQTMPVGTKIGIAWDGVKAYVRLNGTWIDGSDPATGTGGYAFASMAGLGIHAAIASSGTTGSVNFGATAFDYTIPAGFAAWTVAAAPVEIVDLTARGITGTSVQLSFSPLSTAQSYDYTLNNGTSWAALTKNLAIPGLTANTNYSNIKVRGVNTFSGLPSFAASASTLATQTYPAFVTSTADTLNTGMLLTTLRLRLPNANTNYNARAPYGKLPTENGYFEVLAETATPGSSYIGLAGISEGLVNEIAQAGSTAVAYGSAGNIKYNGSDLSTGNGAFGAINQILMVAYKNGKVWFGVDGVWKNGDPATGTGGTTLPNLPAYFPMASLRGSTTAPIWGFNFGATAFTYPVPAGILPWNSTSVLTSFDPSLKHVDLTLSNNNLTVANASATAAYRTALVRGGKSGGKYYYECATQTQVYFGIVRSNHLLTDTVLTATGCGIDNQGSFYVNGTIVTTGTHALGTKIGLAWDGTKVYISHNGVWYNGSDPATGTGGWTYNTGSLPQHAAISVRQGQTGTPNLGQNAFDYAIPAGYSAWTFAG